MEYSPREREVMAFNQVLDTLEGKQNFCIIEERKAPTVYAMLEELSPNAIPDLELNTWYNDADHTYEAVLGQPGYAKAYCDLIDARDQYQRYEFQVAFGTLLGYDIKDCIEFASDPVDCTCSKCGGPETDRDEISRKRWVQAGCPHPLHDPKVLFGQVEYEGTRPKQALTYKGQPYGVLYHPDPELLKHSPGIQAWSIAS